MYSFRLYRITKQFNTVSTQTIGITKLFGEGFNEHYKYYMNKLISELKIVIQNLYPRTNGQKKKPDGKVWYLPHHGVYHSKKIFDKLRVVFNCSANFDGISFNNQLHCIIRTELSKQSSSCCHLHSSREGCCIRRHIIIYVLPSEYVSHRLFVFLLVEKWKY